MDDVDFASIPLVGWLVGISRGRRDIVAEVRIGRLVDSCNSRKRQPVPLASSAFFRKPLVQQALVGAVKATVSSWSIFDEDSILSLAVLQ